MGVATFLQLGFGLLSLVGQNRQLRQEQEFVADEADLQIEELQRQREVENEIADERRADRSREADRRAASLVAALSDGGGATAFNLGRFSGEVGFFEGIDLSRIEGNRRRKVEALASRQRAVQTRALNTIDAKQSQQRSNFFGFLGSAGTSLITGPGSESQKEKTRQRDTTRLP